MSPVDETCTRCPHPFDPHVLVATRNEPVLGGVILCHFKGCECFATWDAPPFSTRETVRVPDAEELAEMRDTVQKEDAPS